MTPMMHTPDGGIAHRPDDAAPTIVVLGSINMDIVATMQRTPGAGETLAGDGFFTAGGGKGANQAVAAARLGASVRMVGRVGDDDFGRAMLASLNDEGVDTVGVALDAANATGVAMIWVDTAGENRIVAVYGANMACDEVQLEAAKRAMDGADVLMLQLEIPPHISLAAAQYARSRGVSRRLRHLLPALQAAQYARSRGLRVVWDPAPASDMPENAFEFADVLTPNQSEAEALTGVRVTGVETARIAADRLLAKGVRLAVVKLGAGGVFAAGSDFSCYQPAFAVDAMDSVAAGDAFGAGLAVALAEALPPQEALRFGAAAGALAVTKPGAQAAMPHREEVDALLAGDAHVG